ncbi:hypothetical protein HALLA_10900 [Halostagnicola larsenii XH-48]|uniref:Halobacterial output domain-containing protein n=1 Tax=Halostagnicola larsenii XH-48 TaxID=797299 RepID=W0JKP6_9EURY|nr:HalOD1 output domain-containing protein [Halostagnicola larsenii]AHF99290.1 hypothetical protein HALLA_10900 [Halostagnicola larsenii XH-48]
MLLSVDGSDRSTQQSLSFEIINAIANEEGVDTTAIEPPEYEPLYEVLNPEALDALFAPREDGTPRTNGRVEFPYCGYQVTVTSDGEVHVRE